MPTLTKHQHRALEAFVADEPTARVIGWDTSVNGPLVEIKDEEWPFYVAISPRGKQVDRMRKD